MAGLQSLKARWALRPVQVAVEALMCNGDIYAWNEGMHCHAAKLPVRSRIDPSRYGRRASWENVQNIILIIYASVGRSLEEGLIVLYVFDIVELSVDFGFHVGVIHKPPAIGRVVGIPASEAAAQPVHGEAPATTPAYAKIVLLEVV